MRSAEFRRSLWAFPVFVACGATQPQPSGANLAPAPTTVSAQEVDAAGSAGGVAQADAAAAPVPTHDAAPAAAGDRAGPFEAAKVKHAQVRALAIGSAVQIFQATQGDDFCPTYAQLIGARVLPSSSDDRDPWGNPYRIECSDSGAVVASNGPDGEPGTPDDVPGRSTP